MTTQDRDFEEIIRSALRAAADSVEPTGDGLQKIRHRLHSPRSARSLLAGCTDWLLLYWIQLRVRLEPATDAGRAALGQLGDRVGTSAPGHRTGARQHAPAPAVAWPAAAAGPWMRPMLAVSAVVAVVVVGFVTLHTVQQATITPTNSVTSPGGHRAGNQPSAGSPARERPSLRGQSQPGVDRVGPPAGGHQHHAPRGLLADAVAESRQGQPEHQPEHVVADSHADPVGLVHGRADADAHGQHAGR